MLYSIVVVFPIYRHETAHPPELPSHLPPHPIPLGCPRAPVLGALLHALSLHWLSLLHTVMYVFQCYSRKSFLF